MLSCFKVINSKRVRFSQYFKNSSAAENLGNIGEAIEHVKLFVAALEELEICCGYDL